MVTCRNEIFVFVSLKVESITFEMLWKVRESTMFALRTDTGVFKRGFGREGPI